MKKLCIVLVLILVLTACSKPVSEVDQTESESFVADIGMIKTMAEEISAVAWAYGGSEDYRGFASPKDISEEGLLNFYLFRMENFGGMEAGFYYYAEGAEHPSYANFTSAKVQDYLDGFFSGAEFSAAELKYEDWLPKAGTEDFEIGVDKLCRYGVFRKAEIDKVSYNPEDKTIRAEGGYDLPEEPAKRDGSKFTAVFELRDGKYFWKSFDLEDMLYLKNYESEETDEYKEILNGLVGRAKFFSSSFCGGYFGGETALEDAEGNEWYEYQWYGEGDCLFRSLEDAEAFLRGTFTENGSAKRMENLRKYYRDIDGKLFCRNVFIPSEYKSYKINSIMPIFVGDDYVDFYVTYTYPEISTEVLSIEKNSGGSWVLGDEFSDSFFSDKLMNAWKPVLYK